MREGGGHHRLLVLGARKKSIGQAVMKMWVDMFDAPVLTAGISGDEMEETSYEADDLTRVIEKFQPTRILCTVGMNRPTDDYEDQPNGFEHWLEDHYAVNVMLPIGALMTWIEYGMPERAQFVALSSNSAVIPRSKSLAYCSSKAALSMALRCAARDCDKAGMGVAVYGYEPGLVHGTPMTAERGGTRMLGLPKGISRRTLAHHIVLNMWFGGPELNGTILRIDNGEV